MKTILAIDDQKDNLMTISAVIKSKMPECVVLTALTGIEGLAIAKAKQPDAILLDIIMPEMDGYEVCKKLKEDDLTKHIPVVMVTAIRADSVSRVKGLSIGADAFLSKPIDPIELSSQINVMLRIKAAEDKLREEKHSLKELVIERTSKLTESEKFMSSLFASVQDGICILQQDMTISHVNETMTSWYRESWPLTGKKCYQAFQNSDKPCNPCPSIRCVKTGKTEMNIVPGAEGSTVEWLELFSYPIKDSNSEKITGVVEFVRDITKRVRDEQIQKVLYNISNAVSSTNSLSNLIINVREELRAIVDTSNFYVALYHQETDMFTVPYLIDENDNFDNFPAGKTLTNYVLKCQETLMASKKRLVELEKSGDVKVLGTIPEMWLGVPLKIGNKVIGVLAVQSYTDENAFNESDKRMLEFVSDQIGLSIHRKKAEEDLVNALVKAQESDRLKSAFLANMSHEIRTPMNGILGFAELLKDPDLSNDELKNYLSVIESSGDRMLNTINDLIDISKIEANQVEVVLAKTIINELINNLYSFFKPEAKKKGLELICCNLQSEKEAIINTDKEKIFSIMTNLIKNSIKYTHTGSIEFGYELSDSSVEFFVKDTGIGIPDSRRKDIFERFVQVDLGKIRVYEGAGLGLAITKAYVDMLGGEIRVESEEGKGTKFNVTIPDIINIREDEVPPTVFMEPGRGVIN